MANRIGVKIKSTLAGDKAPEQPSFMGDSFAKPSPREKAATALPLFDNSLFSECETDRLGQTTRRASKKPQIMDV